MDAMVLRLPGRFHRSAGTNRASHAVAVYVGTLAEAPNSLRCCFETDDRKGEVNEDGG